MDRTQEIKQEIRQCRQLIEQELQWIDSIQWTRREYELLVEYIYNTTEVLLSLSTVRRIWNDDYKNIPQKNTLDALAICAGYKNWLAFLESIPKQYVKPKKKFNSFIVYGFVTLLIVIVLSIFYFFKFENMDHIEIVGDVQFEYAQVSDTSVPNIVVFSYNVEKIIADSFFIVESTHNYRKKRLLNKKGQLTSGYFFPGNYEAFLMANDSIVRKLNIEISSNKWVAMVNYRQSPHITPFYLYNSDIRNDGTLSVSAALLKMKQIKIQDDLNVTFSHTFKSEISLQKNFYFSTRVKLDCVVINSSSPRVYIGLLFEQNMCFVPIVQHGGQGNLQMKFGNSILTSNSSDLSGLGCDIYEWQNVTISSIGNYFAILINHEQVFKVLDSTDMGPLLGFSFGFEGVGAVDYVSLYSTNYDTTFYNTFE